jgi:hypothetical protein
MTDRELLQQALDALISVWNMDKTTKQVESIQAIKARLTQPEPEAEPVAWMFPDDLKRFQTSETFATIFSVACGSPTQGKTVPLYTAPPKNEPVIDKTMATRIATQLGWQPKKEWIGLTDEDIENATDNVGGYKDFARAIDAKLKEKNT